MPPQGPIHGSTDALWAALTPDDRGLVVAVIQHVTTSEILMVGYMNREALETTLDSGKVTFWSRSRQTLWTKGETSGNLLHFHELRVDCDGDALLVQATPAGPTCHTGKPSCFFRPYDAGAGTLTDDEGPAPATDATLDRVFGVVLDRQAGRGATNADGKSYVRSLLDKGVEKISSKIAEEAAELCEALAHESSQRVANEAADLFFHAMVGLAHRAVHIRDVARVFADRFGTSGIDEKAARPRKT
jgi:phosphoribosyl-ATP pyrophosphohydrolase/phosphoribosyl-AMP cyclohydrolase